MIQINLFEPVTAALRNGLVTLSKFDASAFRVGMRTLARYRAEVSAQRRIWRWWFCLHLPLF
jgi:hypothetical protein